MSQIIYCNRSGVAENLEKSRLFYSIKFCCFDFQNRTKIMKKILFAGTFLVAILSAFAFKANEVNSPKTIRYKVSPVGQCQSFSTADCDGPNTHAICSGVFALPNCSQPTYKTN